MKPARTRTRVSSRQLIYRHKSSVQRVRAQLLQDCAATHTQHKKISQMRSAYLGFRLHNTVQIKLCVRVRVRVRS